MWFFTFSLTSIVYCFTAGNSIELGPAEQPPYTVVKRIRGHQVCRRHVPRFLVRGEQIVLVTTIQNRLHYNENKCIT